MWFTAAARPNHQPPIQQGRRGASPAGREDLKWSCVTGGSPSPSAAPGLSGRRKTKKKRPTHVGSKALQIIAADRRSEENETN